MIEETFLTREDVERLVALLKEAIRPKDVYLVRIRFAGEKIRISPYHLETIDEGGSR